MSKTDTFHLRRKYFRLLGAEMKVFDSTGQLVIYAEAKRMKLKEEVTLYRDEAKTQPLVGIKAQQVIDFSPTYDIKDPESGQILSALKRKGWSSTFVQDSWEILTPEGEAVGTIQEDSTSMGMLRRFSKLVSYVVPQNYHISINGEHVGELRRSINLFLVKYDISFDGDYLQNTDWRAALSYPVVLALIEDSKQ